MMKLITIIFITLFLLSSVSAADTFQDARSAYERGDYDSALKLLRPLADQGDANSQFAIGVMYEHGSGVKQNYEEAVNWYNKAALQGRPEAQEFLCLMYKNGNGVKQDDVEASNWCRKAAEQGDAQAQLYLGWMYGSGTGVKQNFEEAFFWLTLASSANPPLDMKDWLSSAAANLSPQQKAAIYKRLAEWNPSSASK